MDLSSGDISTMIFKRVLRADLGEFSLDSHMLSILMELDGKKSLGEIAGTVGLSMGDMRSVIARLVDLQLIEATAGVVTVLNADFVEYLADQLSVAIGPIADVILEDTIEDMGHTPDSFPSHRVAELVDILAKEIRREEKKTEFKVNMVNRIKEMQ